MRNWIKKNEFILVLVVVLIVGIGIVSGFLGMLFSEPASIKDCASKLHKIRKQADFQDFFEGFYDETGQEIYFNPIKYKSCFPFSGFGDYQDIYVFELKDNEMENFINKITSISTVDDTFRGWTYNNCNYTFRRIDKDDKWIFRLSNSNFEEYQLCIATPKESGYADLSSFSIEIYPQENIVGFELFYD